MARDKWRDYVLAVTDGDSQRAIKAKTGIDQGTISRWVSPTQERSLLEAATARKFATAYRRPILEVLVHAGVLSEEETGIKVNPPESLAEVPTADLILEIRRMANELSRRVTDAADNLDTDDSTGIKQLS